MNDNQFYPFYEKIADVIPIPVVGKLLVSILLACLFLVPHFLVFIVNAHDIPKVLPRWDWMIGVIIFLAMSFLYYATYTFRNLFPLLDTLWEPNQDHQHYLIRINKILSNHAFLAPAVVFGFTNLGLGLLFGPPDSTERISLCWGYFLVGFICGLPVWGIFGVIDIIAYLSRAGTFKLDYTSPDGCGGVRFLGDAIIKFSTVTLIVGVLISIYIINASWSNDDLVIMFFKWVWIAFPYVLSLLIIIVPSVGINQLLRDYKFRKDCELKNKLDKLLKKMSNPNNNESSQISDLREQHEHISTLRTKLYQMRIWPFGHSESYKYGAVFISNTAMSFIALPPALKDVIKGILASASVK